MTYNLPESGRVRAVACFSATVRRLLKLGTPENLEIIEEDRALDKGGIEMLLARMLRRSSLRASSAADS